MWASYTFALLGDTQSLCNCLLWTDGGRNPTIAAAAAFVSLYLLLQWTRCTMKVLWGPAIL